MNTGKRRIALLLAAALTFASIESASLMVQAEEVLMVEDEADAAGANGTLQETSESVQADGQMAGADLPDGQAAETEADTAMTQEITEPESQTQETNAEIGTESGTGTESDASGGAEGELLLEPQTEEAQILEVLEPASEMQTEALQTPEDGEIMIEEITVLDGGSELAEGTLPWDGAEVMSLTLDVPVSTESTSLYGVDWYSFTPEASGNYVFTAVGANDYPKGIQIFRADGSSPLVMQQGKMGYVLEAGQMYYYQVSGGIGSYTAKIEKVQAVKDAVLLQDNTRIINQLSLFYLGDVTLTYEDGTTYTFDGQSGTDQLGGIIWYRLYDASGVEAGTFIANTVYNVLVLEEGMYSAEILYNGQPVSEERYPVEIVKPENADLPQLKSGENDVVSGQSYFNKIWYTFSPETTGKYAFLPTGNVSGTPVVDIRKQDGNGNITTVPQSDSLETGVTYYVGIYGTVWDSTTGGVVSEFTMSIAEIPEIESASILSAKTEFIEGLDNAWNHNTKLQISYSDQSLHEVTATGTSVSDGKGNMIYCTLQNMSGESLSWGATLESGKYNWVFTYGEKELCRQEITVLPLESLNTAEKTLSSGSNSITSGTSSNDCAWYTFTPDETSVYSFAFETTYTYMNMTIRKSDDLQTMVQQGEKLEAGATYYLGFYAYSTDGTVQECTLTISKVPEIASASLLSAKTEFIEGLDNVSSQYVKLRLTYTDESTLEILTYAGNISDGKGNTIYCELRNASEQSIIWGTMLEPGTYNLVFICAGEELCRQEITVFPIERLSAAENVLSLGENNITSGANWNYNWYSFTPEERAGYLFDFGPGYMPVHTTIRKSDDLQTTVQQGEKLEAGVTYYLGFRSIDNADRECILTISKGKEIQTAEMLSENSTFIAGVDSSYVYTALRLTYQDGSTRDLQISVGSSAADNNGNLISSEVVDQDGNTVTWNGAGPGRYTVIFSDGEQELCRRELQIVNIEDAVEGKLSLGSNHIEGNEAQPRRVYSFTPEQTGDYIFDETRYGSIFLGVYQRTDSGLSWIETYYNGYAEMYLEQATTYYMVFTGEGVDMWGDLTYDIDIEIEISHEKEPVKIELAEAYSGVSVIAGISSVSKELDNENLFLRLHYSDGTSEIKTYGAIRNEPSRRTKLYAESGEEVALDTAAPGKYEVEITYFNASLRIPAEIKPAGEVCSGTWDLWQPLAVNTESGEALYQLTTSVGGEYQLQSNISLSGAKLYDSKLETAASTGNGLLMNIRGKKTTLELEADSRYYLYIPQGIKCTLTAELCSEAEIKEMTVAARKDSYLADFEEVSPDDFRTEITYSDGSVNTVYGEETVYYRLQDKDENYYWFYGATALPAGAYTVTPQVTSGAAIDVKTNSAAIMVQDLDTASLPLIKEGDTVQKLSGTEAAKNLYRFVPESDGVYTYVCEEGSFASVAVYTYDGERWVETNEWEMSAGETYVLKAAGGSFAFSIQKKAETPVLTLGEKITGTVPDLGGYFGYMEYTFTAPESGWYTMTSEGTFDRMELWNEHRIQELDSNPHELYEGETYTYRVYGVPGDSFSLTLSKTDLKTIEKVEFLPDVFDLEYKWSSYSLVTTGTVAKITYTDESSWALSSRAGYYNLAYDGYGNEMKWRSRPLSEAEDGQTYEIAVRYRPEQGSEWTYVYEDVKIPYISTKANKQLAVNVPTNGTFNSAGRDYYRISVEESGTYQFSAENAEAFIDGTFDLFDAFNRKLEGKTNDTFYLQAGSTYYLRFAAGMEAAGASYTLLMTRRKELSSIEILSVPERVYGRIGVSESEVQLKISYTDGTEEILNGTRYLADGRAVKREYRQLSNTRAKLTYSLGDCLVSTELQLTDISEAPQMTVDGGKGSITFDGAESSQQYRYVMQVTPKYTGAYELTTTAEQPVQNVYAEIYDGNLFGISTLRDGIYLEEGKTYYIVVSVSTEDGLPLEQLSVLLTVEDHICDWQPGAVLKEASCLEEGEQEKICSICGASESFILPALGHEFGEEWTTETEPSETETGRKYQQCSRCPERKYEIIPSLGTAAKIEEVQSAIEDITVSGSGGELTQEEQNAVVTAVDSLVQIDNEEALAVADIIDTIEKLDKLAVKGLPSVSETKVEVAEDVLAQIGMPEVKGAALTAAAVSQDAELGGNETLSVQVNMDVSEDSYEDLQGQTVAVDITMDVVKVNADGKVTETVQSSIQPKTPIQVTMRIPDEFVDKTFVLYHVSGGERQQIVYTFSKDNKITFATPSLSDFVLHLTDCGEGKHTWKTGQILKEASCTEYGRIADLCENCEQKQNEKQIPMKAHEWKKLSEKAATCSEEGYIVEQCASCKAQQKTVTAPATGAHVFAKIVDQNATCAAAGSQHRQCTVCGFRETATAIPATGAHVFTTIVDQNATCAAAGSQHRECTVCGYREAATAIPAAGVHTFGAFTETKAATAVEEGVRTRSCTVCGVQESETIAKLPATIELSANSVVLKTGQSTKAFRVTGMADGDSVKSIVSSKNAIVKVSGVTANGTCKLKAQKKTGSAKLTITLASGLTKVVNVKVQKNAVKTTSIKNVQKKLTLNRKQKVKLTPVLNPITSQDKITYTSSNKKVATVTSKGIVKGIKAGKAKITVKAGGKKFVCTVTVKK